MTGLIDLPTEHFDSAAWLEAGLVWCSIHPDTLVETRFGGRLCEPCRLAPKAAK